MPRDGYAGRPEVRRLPTPAAAGKAYRDAVRRLQLPPYSKSISEIGRMTPAQVANLLRPGPGDGCARGGARPGEGYYEVHDADDLLRVATLAAEGKLR